MAEERSRRRLLSCVLETSPDLEAWIGPGGDCQDISPSCEDLTGYAPEAYRADPVLLVRCGHPDDQDRLRASIFGDGTIAQTFCCRVVTRNGEIRRIVHRSIPCQDEAGHPIGVRVHQQRAPDEDPAHEIQRLRALLGQTEGDRALLTAVIESLPVGVIAMGGAGELLVANPAAVPYLEQVRGAPLPAEAYLGHYRELERQLRGPDGLPQYLHLTAGPLARTGHRIFGAVGAIQDITHTRASAQARRRELAESKQQVWRLEGANTDLVLRLEALESRLDEVPRAAAATPGPAAPLAAETVTMADSLDDTAVLEAVPDQVWVLDAESPVPVRQPGRRGRRAAQGEPAHRPPLVRSPPRVRAHPRDRPQVVDGPRRRRRAGRDLDRRGRGKPPGLPLCGPTGRRSGRRSRSARHGPGRHASPAALRGAHPHRGAAGAAPRGAARDPGPDAGRRRDRRGAVRTGDLPEPGLRRDLGGGRAVAGPAGGVRRLDGHRAGRGCRTGRWTGPSRGRQGPGKKSATRRSRWSATTGTGASSVSAPARSSTKRGRCTPRPRPSSTSRPGGRPRTRSWPARSDSGLRPVPSPRSSRSTTGPAGTFS